MNKLLLLFAVASAMCVATLASAQETHSPIVNRHSEEEQESFRNAREAWIRSMHRAEPGLNWEAIDAATREAKTQAYYNSRKFSKSASNTFSIPQDTFAGGKIIGTWSERGSNNVCGRTHTGDIDFDTDTIFVASSMGDIWKTRVGDSVWTILNDAGRFGDIRLLRVIHTATGKRLIAACNGPVIFRYSDDGGKTWNEAEGLSGPKSWGGIKKATVSFDEDTIYLVGNEWDYSAAWRAVAFLYRSTDQGAHFKKIGNWPVSSDLCDVWQSRDERSPAYFIKSDSLFTVTSDSTLALVKVLDSATIGTASAVYLDAKNIGGKTTLGIAAYLNDTSRIYSSPLPLTTWTYRGFVPGGPFTAISFRLSATEPFRCYFGDFDVHVNSDTSKLFDIPHQWWEYYGNTANELHADIDGIDIFNDPTGKELTLFSTDGGTFISYDTMHTVHNLTLSGIRTSQYYSTYTSAKPYVIQAGAQDQGWQRGADSAAGILNMDQIYSGDYGHIVSGDSGNSVFGDYPGFVIYYYDARNSDSHHDWSFVGSNKLWMPPMTASPTDRSTCYVACGDSSANSSESHMWKLTDNGTSLVPTMMPYDFSLGNGNRNLSAMAFSPFDTLTMYALSNDGYFFRSSDAGVTWTHSDTNSAPGSHYFYGSTIVPSHLVKNKLWVAGSGYSNPAMYVSTDNGKTFMPADSGLPNTLIYNMVASEDEEYLFAGTDVGPYIYSTAANRWYDMQAPNRITAPDMVFWSVEKVPQSHTIRFGTYGRGMWDFTYDTISHVEGSVAQATAVAPISVQAYPTPTNSATTLRISLPQQEPVSLSIYDLQGKRVRHNEWLATSTTEQFSWDTKSDAGASVPTGFYTAIVCTTNGIGFVKIEVVR